LKSWWCKSTWPRFEAFSPMTIGEFISEIEALVLKARIGGIPVEQKIAVLHGMIDALKEASHGDVSRSLLDSTARSAMDN
jgi:hypothetical protein